MRKFLGYTWIGWLNILLVQWFFVRLCYDNREDKLLGLGLLYWVVPWTGWFVDYIPKKNKCLTIWKRKI